MVIIKETDSDIEDTEEEPVEKHGEIEIGSYKAHVETAKKGMYDFGIWSSLTKALVAMAYPNSYHRVNLTDKEFLKRIEKDMDLEIDYEYLNSEILKKPFLIRPNGEKPPIDKTKDEHGKPRTKKAIKTIEKKEKVQTKIDALKLKYKKMKSKKGPRAAKLKTKIEELEAKRDHIV